MIVQVFVFHLKPCRWCID